MICNCNLESHLMVIAFFLRQKHPYPIAWWGWEYSILITVEMNFALMILTVTTTATRTTERPKSGTEYWTSNDKQNRIWRETWLTDGRAKSKPEISMFLTRCQYILINDVASCHSLKFQASNNDERRRARCQSYFNIFISVSLKLVLWRKEIIKFATFFA